MGKGATSIFEADATSLYLSLNHLPGWGFREGQPGIEHGHYLHRTLHEIESEFENHRKEFKAGGGETFLKAQMAAVSKERHLNNIVSFGTTSLQSSFDGMRRRAHLQIAAMMTMLDSINEGRKQEDFARCFSQEPCYTDLDKEFLRKHGIQPVDDPEGWALIGQDSVFCEWAVADFVVKKVSEGPWPAVIISVRAEAIRKEKDLEQEPEPHEEMLPNGQTLTVFPVKMLTSAEAQHILDMVDSCEHHVFPLGLEDMTNPQSIFKGYVFNWRRMCKG
ncbi:MAG: hypothetical protein Q9222_006403 [Ikaeria aurantiellina]